MAENIKRIDNYFASRYGKNRIYTDSFLDDISLIYLINVSTKKLPSSQIKSLFWEFVGYSEDLEYNFNVDPIRLMMCCDGRLYYSGFLEWIGARMEDEWVYRKELREFRRRIRELKKH